MYNKIYTNLQQTQGFGRWEFTYNNIIQCVFPVGNIKHFDWVPEEFINSFDLQDDHLIGAETIPANTMLDAHTDHIRKSNMLINVGSEDAVIFHTNNDVHEEVIIAPGNKFLINTQKLHGSKNTHNYDYQFLTINIKQSYIKAREHFDV